MDNSRPRVVCVRSLQDAEEEMTLLGVDPDGLEVMAPRALLRAVKVRGVPSHVARSLKSLMLKLGGEVAIPSLRSGQARSARFAQNGPTDALVLGTLSQFSRLCDALRASPAEFADLADVLAGALDRFDAPRGKMRCRDTVFEWGSRTYVMGIINMSPDSFSGDGLSGDVQAAIEQGRRFIAEGADILDVGGESTRPGHTAVSLEEEAGRALPVVEALLREFSVPVSIDTNKAEVARRALELGVSMVNDIWGLRADRAMAAVVGAADVPVVLMHNQDGTEYDSLMDEVIRSLGESVDMALRAGVKWENIIIDPGIGFGKTWQQNLKVLARLSELKSLGRPILLGTSRKSTIGRVLNVPADDRLEGTAATVAIGIANGADIVRVHDVREMVRVSRMTDAMVRERWPE